MISFNIFLLLIYFDKIFTTKIQFTYEVQRNTAYLEIPFSNKNLRRTLDVSSASLDVWRRKQWTLLVCNLLRTLDLLFRIPQGQQAATDATSITYMSMFVRWHDNIEVSTLETMAPWIIKCYVQCKQHAHPLGEFNLTTQNGRPFCLHIMLTRSVKSHVQIQMYLVATKL